MAHDADPAWLSPSYRSKPQFQEEDLASSLRALRTKKTPPHDPETAEILEPEAEEAIQAAGREGDLFPVLTVAQAKALPPPKWLIANLIPENSLTVLYAPSVSLKSFFTVDLAIHLAYGQAWLGRPTRRMGVCYVAAEGAAGLGKRMEAWERHHNLLDADNLFRLIPATVNILDEEEVERCILTIQE